MYVTFIRIPLIVFEIVQCGQKQKQSTDEHLQIIKCFFVKRHATWMCGSQRVKHYYCP